MSPKGIPGEALPKTNADINVFKRASEIKTRLVTEHWGGTKTYKTGLAYTYPAPLYHINFDRNADPLRRWFPGKDIRVLDLLLPFDEEITVAVAKDFLTRFLAGYKAALKQEEGTLIVDTVSHLWKIIQVYVLKGIEQQRAAKNPNKAQIYPFDYADANLVYENILLAASKAYNGPNVVFIGRAKEVYNDQGNPTGDLAPQTQKETSYMVDFSLKMAYREKRTVVKELKSGQRMESTVRDPHFVATVMESGYDLAHKGLEIEDPTYEKILVLTQMKETKTA